MERSKSCKFQPNSSFRSDFMAFWIFKEPLNFSVSSNFLEFHHGDFKFQAEWKFFATSHSKNACDGVGGTIKRLAAHASLQHPFSDQILTPKQLLEFANSNVEGVTSFFEELDTVIAHTECLESQFASAKTFKGTISNHQFISSKNSLILKKTPKSVCLKEVSLSAGGNSKLKVSVKDIKPERFYACRYNNDWYFCNANCVSVEDGDINVKFLHPKRPALKFFWPCCDDICWIPTEDFHKEVEAPSTGSTARYYSFDEKVMNDVNNFFQ